MTAPNPSAAVRNQRRPRENKPRFIDHRWSPDDRPQRENAPADDGRPGIVANAQAQATTAAYSGNESSAGTAIGG